MRPFDLVYASILLGGFYGIKIFMESAIGKVPDRLHDLQLKEVEHENSLNLEDHRASNSRNLQVESFFREVSGLKLEEILGEWTSMLTDAKRFALKTPEEINDMIKRLLLYGSEESIRRGAIFQQYNYTTMVKHSERTKDYDPAVLVYLVAYLIQQLKKDFTGYEIDPDDIIKMKITDYETPSNKKRFKNGQKEAKKLLGL